MSPPLLILHFAAAAAVSIGAPQSRALPEPSPQGDTSVIHCYCNMPECVRTGYMCKSQGRGCFSDLVSDLDVERAIHGCIDLLPPGRGSECENLPGKKELVPGASSPSLLLCCSKDMCNHVDSPEARSNYNHTITGPGPMAGMGRMPPPTHTSQEIWLKAATIAVPICGAVILLVLVLLAVKILRSDVLDDNRIIAAKLRKEGCGSLGSVRCSECGDGWRCSGLHPVLLLSDKNARHARLNSAGGGPGDLFRKADPAALRNTYTSVPLLPPLPSDKILYKKAFVPWSHPN